MFEADYDPSTWIPYLIVLFDLFKGVAWPVAALLIASVYSREIKQIIPRIKQLGPTGVHIRQVEQDDRVPEGLTSSKVSLDPLDDLEDQVAAEIEEENRALLKNIPEDAREDRLLRALTWQQLQRNFAMAYLGIFGSQIRALKDLNSRRISRSEAEEMFSNLQDEKPAFEHWTIDEYLNFLFTWRFISFDSGTYSITETGKNFLRFLIENSLPEDKPN